MSFLFVDKIHAMDARKVRGRFSFPEDTPWQRAHPDGSRAVCCGAIAEAIGQLASWKAIHDNDFTRRPVYLFASESAWAAVVEPGDTIDLEAWVSEQSEEYMVFSGLASVAGREVAQTRDCHAYFMPLAEMEDPGATRERFDRLRGDDAHSRRDAPRPFDLGSLLGEITAAVPGKSLTTRRTFAAGEPYYADHFPRFPVTPIVILGEMITQIGTRLCHGFGARWLEPICVKDLKIRSFIRPGDSVETTVSLLGRDESAVALLAEVSMAGCRVLRGRYRYRMKGV